jgi:hypothetical protein
MERSDCPTMPVWNVLVGNTGCDVKHDDATLPVDVIAISEAPEFLLACSVPHIESDWSKVLNFVRF